MVISGICERRMGKKNEWRLFFFCLFLAPGEVRLTR